uniref:Tetraspanin n=1 Tax=Amphiprion percula TaxID=161767 RepID=A0A3P8U9L1_AMPPE
MAVNKCIKYLLFFFNLLFWLSGCIILAVSIYLKVSKHNSKITDESLPGVDLMIAIGVIIMVLGCLGCCGAIRENRCMLLLFFISLLLIFILLLAAGILAAVAENKVRQEVTQEVTGSAFFFFSNKPSFSVCICFQVEEWVKESLDKFTPLSDQKPDVIEDLEKMQRELKCCGLINGQQDWAGKIPNSCKCNSTETSTCTGTYYDTPCATQIVKLLESNMEVVIGIAFAIAVLLIFGMVFSMILYCQIGRKQEATTTA